MADKVVGEAKVRIRPLTDAFRAETQADVDKATSGVTGTVGIKVDDTRLKALQGDLTTLARRTWTTTVAADDAKGKAAVDRMTARLEQLGRKVAKPEISLQGYLKTIAEIASINAALDDVDHKAREASGSGSGLARLATMLGSLGAEGGSGLLSAAGTGVIIAGLAALAAIMAGPLLAALLPITLGFGALALAGKLAIDGLSQKWKNLDPQQRAVKKSLDDVKSSFGNMAKSVQPQILDIFATGLRIIKSLLPALKPLLKAAADAADTFAHNIADWLNSPSGKKFLNWLETQGPKDIKTFGAVLWTIAQIGGRTFSFLNNAGNTWWKNTSHVVHDITRFFTVVIPGALRILKDEAKITWDKMEIDVLSFVDSVVSTFAKLPGPMGKPFRDARANIEAELGRLKISVAKDEGDIQNTLDRLHGHSVTLSFGLGLPAGVSIPGARTGQRTAPIPGHAAGTGGAAPGWAIVGERGPELVSMHGGETVIPNHATMKVLNGYAGGTSGWDVTGAFHPDVSTFDRQLTAAFNATEQALISAVQKTAQLSGGGFGFAGPGGGAPAANAALARRLFPGEDFAAWNYVAMRESGWNQFALNPSSGAYGIAQALPPTKYPFAGQAAGGSNPTAQISWMEGYMRQRYGGAAGAAAHEAAFNWYGKGTTNAERIARALRVIHNHPGLPQRYTRLEIELESWQNKVRQDRALKRAGVHMTGLDADERHVRNLRRLIAPLSRDRHIVRRAEGVLSGRESRLPGEISAARARGMGRLAGRLTGRLSHDRGLDKTFSGWLDRLGPAYTRRDKRHDTDWIDSLISSDVKGLGLPVGSFDKGGWLPAGLSLAYNGLGRPERVGSTPTVILQLQPPGSSATDRFFTEWLQRAVQVKGGGDVQVAFGRVN